ncbi:MAG TPA: phosphatidylglycerophosphatase A [Candidatus Dormibacteraeota bacterium]|nr:phosphatidylglycerophosphatase A [Candidatus Dormibacteraeota bacterium]
MTPNIEVAALPETTRKKPRLAFAIATVLGVGYAPKAPGTLGSLVGIVVAILTNPSTYFVLLTGSLGMDIYVHDKYIYISPVLFLVPSLIAIVVVALVGVWSASRVAEYSGIKDPQYVVIDEVSGTHVTLVLALVPLGSPTTLISPDNASVFALYSGLSLLNWKYLLAGFLLFRLFDIWKPYPIRWLEKLPGGWGIMADDWLAGVYAAIVLRVAVQLLHL